MTFFNYLKDKLTFIIFYCSLMIFISITIYIDRTNSILSTNILYIDIVSTILFLLFLIIDFIRIKNYSRQLKKICDLRDADVLVMLPVSVTYEQKIYNEFITTLYSQYSDKILEIENEFKENTDFLTAWVHEIKTPITAIKLVTENNYHNNETLDIVQEEINRIEDYVQKVLYYSIVNDFSKDYIINSTDMSKVIKNSIKKHSTLFIQKHIGIKLENINFILDTDIKWIEFIIDQLISNALKYTNNKGSIIINIMENNKEFVLSIKDNGVGIKTEDMPKLFNRTFTGYNGRTETSTSTGLGLYLSQKLANKLGHHITINSELGVGTEACVHFPKLSDYYDVAKM